MKSSKYHLPLRFCFNFLLCLALFLNCKVNVVIISCCVSSSFFLLAETGSNSFSVTIRRKQWSQIDCICYISNYYKIYLPSISEVIPILFWLFSFFCLVFIQKLNINQTCIYHNYNRNVSFQKLISSIYEVAELTSLHARSFDAN